MRALTSTFAVTSTLLFGAIFGFFFAWICSTMWAFDLLAPEIAIEVMQVVNREVRNMTFMPAFFFTPFAGLLTAALLWANGAKSSAFYFVAASLVYLGGGLILTMSVHVPLNEALDVLDLSDASNDAEAIWHAYSRDWQIWNITRTVFSGLALALAALGLIAAPARAARPD